MTTVIHYESLPEERQEYIRNLADKIKKYHDASTIEDLIKTADRCGCRLLVTDKAVYSHTLDIRKKGRRYAVIKPYFSKSKTFRTAAHEFGHLILGHGKKITHKIRSNPIEQLEADFFADNMMLGYREKEGLLRKIFSSKLCLTWRQRRTLKELKKRCKSVESAIAYESMLMKEFDLYLPEGVKIGE